ncbi:serine/threonine protein kinase [Micromonospora sp. 15K316]|uniref:serine/threonine-protein kinase n=1 Tax=Micromonospora sp. 15K316 TaxID=2530376 RepID=UPI0010496FAE|nr:serine/threonine-protein kinase [Micromonospora sp. 15K316]TDC29201.1 serine/threonine protein kinase [Micromonospora sp. 15K316]
MSNALPQLVADRYRLISPLGQGGMGRVWKARDEVLHRDVAIKELVPPPSLTDDERREMRERSLREARAIARLNHINVVRIFDVLRTDGDPWIVMEYVASKSLQDTLAESGPVPSARAIEIGLGVLGALKAAHKAGVMHRDVKPGNVLLGNDGRVVLTDFGLATIPGDPNVTRTGMVLGSPAYIAPERAHDGTAGPEADLWSLGATLYAAVEGKSPYARPSAIATLAALATEPLPPPKNAGPLKPVLQGLLRKDPRERIDAETAERMLRRANGRRSRGISLLDGVRRPGPNGPRLPRPTVVPAPRPAEPAEPPVAPPAPRAPSAAALAGPAADATAKVPAGVDAAPTAKVDRSTVDAEPTTIVDRPASADPTAKIDLPARDAEPTTTVDRSTADDAPTTAEADRSTTDAEPTTTVDRSTVDADRTAKVEPPAASADSRPSTKAGGSGESVEVARPADGRRTERGASAPHRPANPTSVLPASPPAGPTGRAPIPATDGTPTDRKRRNLLVGVLVAVLLVGLAVVVPLLTSGDDPEDGDRPTAGGSVGSASASAPPTSAPASPPPTSAAPSVTPSASASPSGGIPAGWSLRKDPVGFSLPIPKGWIRSAGGTWVRYADPNGVGELTIDRTSNPGSDAAKAWRDIEPDRASLVNNYENLGIHSIDCRWKTCADWDWLETRDGTRIHVRNRGFVTAHNRGFALRWEVAQKDWTASLPNFEMIFREFVPDRQD